METLLLPFRFEFMQTAMVIAVLVAVPGCKVGECLWRRQLVA